MRNGVLCGGKRAYSEQSPSPVQKKKKNTGGGRVAPFSLGNQAGRGGEKDVAYGLSTVQKRK